MHILLMTDGIYPHITGGMQKHSYYLTKYLLLAGHKVTLVHCHEKTTLSIHHVLELDEGNTNIKEIVIPFPRSLKFPGHYFYNSYRYSKMAYFAIKKSLNQFDKIYIQGFSGWYLLKKNYQKNNIILNFHGLEMFQLNVGFIARLQATLFRFFVKKNLLRAAYVQSLGGNITQLLANRVGVSKEKILEFPIGIEKKWLSKSELINHEILQFVFIGRNEPRKGLPALLKILEKLSHLPFHLHIIGPFPKFEGSKFTYHGKITSEDSIMKILDECDVLLCPSHAEGMPTVILEAMSRGCAIAASNVGAVCCEVDDNNGWLFEPNNMTALEKTITKVISTPRNELLLKREASRKKILTFFWNDLINKMF